MREKRILQVKTNRLVLTLAFFAADMIFYLLFAVFIIPVSCACFVAQSNHFAYPYRIPSTCHMSFV